MVDDPPCFLPLCCHTSPRLPGKLKKLCTFIYGNNLIISYGWRRKYDQNTMQYILHLFIACLRLTFVALSSCRKLYKYMYGRYSSYIFLELGVCRARSWQNGWLSFNDNHVTSFRYYLVLRFILNSLCIIVSFHVLTCPFSEVGRWAPVKNRKLCLWACFGVGREQHWCSG